MMRQLVRKIPFFTQIATVASSTRQPHPPVPGPLSIGLGSSFALRGTSYARGFCSSGKPHTKVTPTGEEFSLEEFCNIFCKSGALVAKMIATTFFCNVVLGIRFGDYPRHNKKKMIEDKYNYS